MKHPYLARIFANLRDERHAIALIDHEGRSHTYAAIGRRAWVLAAHLARAGVGPGDRVGVGLERCADLMPALLAVWMRGAAYVPMDPAYPAARIEVMIEDGAVSVALARADGALADAFALARVQVIDPDRLPPLRASASVVVPPPADGLAYVIFTSGSTGRPKGVMIEHRSVQNLLTSYTRVPGLAQSDRMLWMGSISFDIHVPELWTPLVVGGTVVMAGEAARQNPGRLRAFLEQTRPSVVQFTPTQWRLLLGEGWRPGWPMRCITGGEALERGLADRLCAISSDVWDGYGPTETTVWSAFARVGGPIVLGEPVARTTLYLLPVEQPGTGSDGAGDVMELCIGGAGVARGYIGRPELTAQRFMPIERLDVLLWKGEFIPGDRLYRTGDLVRVAADGTVAFAGRADHQVKVNGHRVELGEVEAVLNQAPEVCQAAVVVRRRADGDRFLAGFVEWARGPAAQLQDDGWREVWDSTYEAAARASDPLGASGSEDDALFASDLGLGDSHSGGILPEASVRQYRLNALDKIRGGAVRYLEIGSGAGSLALTLLAEAESYCAVDLSPAALELLRRRVDARMPAHAARLETRCGPARRVLESLGAARYDVIVCNSVMQYLPDAACAIEVIAGAVDRLAQRGRLFLGDLRDAELVEVHHFSVARRRYADAPVPLMRHVARMVGGEGELTFGKALWSALHAALEGRGLSVLVELKNGPIADEFTRARYDVHLVRAPSARRHISLAIPARVDFELSALWRCLRHEGALRISNLLDARVHAEIEDFVAACGAVDADPIRHEPAIARVLARGHALGERLDADHEGTLSARWDDAVAGLVDLAARAGQPIEVRRVARGAGLPHAFDMEVCLTGRLSAVASPVVERLRRADVRGALVAASGAIRAPDGRSDPDDHALRRVADFARRSLPEYMVPAAWAVLDALPLTPNGKLDRLALAEMSVAPLGSAAFDEPTTDAQRTLCALFGELLQIDHVSATDDFFDLGGGSLGAARLASRARAALDGRVTFGLIARHRTPRAIAAALVAGELALVPRQTVLADAGRLGAWVEPPIQSPRRLEFPCVGDRLAVLTGATGFVGISVLAHLLRRGFDVVCLVRADGLDHGCRRLRDTAAARGIRLGAEAWARVHPLVADLAEPALGLSPASRAALLDPRIRVIVHCGAKVNLLDSYDSLRAANVDSTRWLLSAAAANARPPRFVYVSSLDVVQPLLRETGGNRGSAPPLVAGPIPDLPAYATGYPATKWCAEQLVDRAVAEQGLDACNVRLGQVVGHGVDDLFGWLIDSFVELGCFPLDNVDLGAIPVDIAARFIVDLGRLPGPLPHRTWHVDNPVRLPLALLPPVLAPHGISVRGLAFDAWVEKLRRAVSEAPNHPLGPFVDMICAGSPAAGDTWLQTISFGSQRISTTAAQAFMRQVGIRCPPVTGSMLLAHRSPSALPARESG